MASMHRRIHLTGLAWTLFSTSPHAPRLRPRLLPLVAIQFTTLIHLSAIAGATVFTIHSISPAVRCSQGSRDLHRHAPNHRHCGDVCSRAPRAQHRCSSLCPHCTLLVVYPWRRSPAAFTAARCASSSSPLLMHPPSFAHTQNSFLSYNRTTNSFTAANACAHFDYHHGNSILPLHWPRWSASDTCTHFSPDPASFTKDDTRAPPLLLKYLAFASALATTIWPPS